MLFCDVHAIPFGGVTCYSDAAGVGDGYGIQRAVGQRGSVDPGPHSTQVGDRG